MIFPSYRDDEAAVDRIIHVIGIVVALCGLTWLLARSLPLTNFAGASALIIYSVGVLCMLGASAAYNLCPPSPLKATLCLVDRSMIFVMIAGSYAPYALHALPPNVGLPLFIVVCALALVGVVLTLFWFQRFQKVSLWLYLGMGWLLVAVLRPLIASLPPTVLYLLLGGGLTYSLGTVFHSWERLRFHNAIWHLLVLMAVLMHLAAIMLIFAPHAHAT
ncbi:MAG: PAQR family membrane homeostasis protein TrhA [Janthinobacterium lividum]